MNVMTCNIRCYGGNDGDDHWPHRKDFCAEVIQSRKPDLICFQEMWAEQFVDLKPMFPEFDSYGMIDEPQTFYPMNTIFYRRDAFDYYSAGGYWLSETPHVTGSKSWDSACVRLANWLRLRDRTSGKEFRVINTHLDHKGQVARENQARIICEDAVAYPDDYPQILTGDLNCDAHNAAIGVLRDRGWTDTYGAVHGTETPGFTYHAFDGPDYAEKSNVDKMDWVFARGAVDVKQAEIIDDERDGRFPSDHYFVSAEIEL
ncbi:MAG: endonuclease/exonuclease/phosphatase family protein [Candidatus Latescibacteria bacterium]|jgi:endonuclease/exonuclease/phosphatase family metal-dependent hydrolase|nr:endonuclease/exonuclease/phosphatase family protein [Candidatus Latescibacterota bacterium]